MPIGGFDFGDFSGMALGFAEEIADQEKANHDAKKLSTVNVDVDMTEDEALELFDAAEALGIGEKINLSEAQEIKHQRFQNESLAIADDLIEDGLDVDPTSLRSRKIRVDSPYSSVSERLKCPFEQWIKDICTGRKTIHDPVGGANSYGKSKY